MDLSSLAELGKVAGVAGIAIGLIALLAPQFIKGASSLPRAERGPMLRLVAIGAFAIGALGIIAWLHRRATMGTSVKAATAASRTAGLDGQHGELWASAALRQQSHDARSLSCALRLPSLWRSPSGTAAVALGDKVEAGSCAIANSGSASGNTVTCNFGLTPEQLKQVTEAAVKGATEPLDSTSIVEISKTLGVTEDAAKTLLKIVGEDPNIPDDKLAEALTKVAGDYKRLQAQVAALNPDNPTARALVEEAKPEIEAGHFERARELLRQATQAQIAAAQEARKLKEQAQAAEDAQMLGAASSTAAEGDVALTERRYLEAAELFGQAAGYVPSGHASERGGYLAAPGRRPLPAGRRARRQRRAAQLDRGLRTRLGGISARAGAARLGDDAEQSRQCALERSASGRAGRRGWRRRSRPIARRWRNGRASGFRSTGRRRRTISAMRSRRSASGRAGRRGWRRRSRPIARRWRNGRASGFRSTGR